MATNVLAETEQESDDDGEVYFLKPVNEYNIVDKIKEANRELFGADTRKELELELLAGAQQNRKVSFAANLEEYEPKSGLNFKELEARLGKDEVEDGARNCVQANKDQKLDIIAEEESLQEIESNETGEIRAEETEYQQEDNGQGEKEEEQEPIRFAETNEDVVSSENPDSTQEADVVLEEICEEILIMDIESDKAKLTQAAECVTTGHTSSMQRQMLKQTTFDLTEEDEESDNKSLTNLLISDNEDEAENQEYNCNESLNDNDSDSEVKELLAPTEYYNDNEEDDKLSIIVASYSPDVITASDKALLTPPGSSKTRKLPFNKRFSLRRKAKSSNAIGSSANHHISHNGRFKPPPEVTDLKLHYKTCCDFRNGQQNLPKYTGHLSEYGLTREQLMERERKLQQKQQAKMVQSLKTSEVEARKIHDNDRAFTTWLKNKMRFPINKTRNMFDVKRPFGLRKCTSLGGNSLHDDTRQILNTTKYRSISAKFQKA